MITQDKLTPHFELSDVSSVLNFMKFLKINYVYNDLGYLAEDEIKLPVLIQESFESLIVSVNVNAFPNINNISPTPEYITLFTIDKSKCGDNESLIDLFIEAELNAKPFEYFNMLDINKIRRNKND